MIKVSEGVYSESVDKYAITIFCDKNDFPGYEIKERETGYDVYGQRATESVKSRIAKLSERSDIANALLSMAKRDMGEKFIIAVREHKSKDGDLIGFMRKGGAFNADGSKKTIGVPYTTVRKMSMADEFGLEEASYIRHMMLLKHNNNNQSWREFSASRSFVFMFHEGDPEEGKFKSYCPEPRRIITQDMRRMVYAKTHGHCAYCGRPIEMREMQVDHVTSHHLHQGKDRLDNYLPACRDCNGAKSNFTLEEFRCAIIPSCGRAFANGGRKRLAYGSPTRADRLAMAYGLDKAPNKRITFYFEQEDEK